MTVCYSTLGWVLGTLPCLTVAEIQLKRLDSRKIAKESEGLPEDSPYRHLPLTPFPRLYPEHFLSVGFKT